MINSIWASFFFKIQATTITEVLEIDVKNPSCFFEKKLDHGVT